MRLARYCAPQLVNLTRDYRGTLTTGNQPVTRRGAAHAQYGRVMTAADDIRDHHEQLRAALLEARQRTTESIESLHRDIAAMAQDARLSVADDEHDPEGSTVSLERSKAVALLATAKGHLSDVDDALKKIDADAYGRCESCREVIALPRLLARPAARLCIRCAAKS